MKADYDSEANALSIDLVDRRPCDDTVGVDEDDCCNIGLSEGLAVTVELLRPADNLDLLPVAGERFDIDSEGLLAAAKAALAAPDRVVTIGLSRRLAGSR